MTGRRGITVLLAVTLVLVAAGPAAGWEAGEEDEPVGVPFEPPPFERPTDIPETGPFDAPPGELQVAVSGENAKGQRVDRGDRARRDPARRPGDDR